MNKNKPIYIKSGSAVHKLKDNTYAICTYPKGDYATISDVFDSKEEAIRELNIRVAQ